MSEGKRSDAPADSAGFLLWRVSNAWQRAVRIALAPFELTHAQYVVLATLDWIGGDATAKQNEVASLSGMDPMTTSQVARSLVQRELLRRESHPQDGRAFQLALTQKGRRAVVRAGPAVAAVESEFFGPLGRQHRHLHSTLTTLASR